MSEGDAAGVVRQGDVYWLESCPPLEGEVAKRRPVVVISPDAEIARGGPLVVVVAASSSVLESEKSRIELPGRDTEPQTKSGLPRRCWVVPRWYLAVERVKLKSRVGFISGRRLVRVVTAVVKAMGEGER